MRVQRTLLKWDTGGLQRCKTFYYSLNIFVFMYYKSASKFKQHDSGMKPECSLTEQTRGVRN